MTPEEELAKTRESLRRMHRRAQRAYSLGRRDMEREHFNGISMAFTARVAEMLGIERDKGSWFDYEARVLERIAELSSIDAEAGGPSLSPAAKAFLSAKDQYGGAATARILAKAKKG